jgi:hypothetical protein
LERDFAAFEQKLLDHKQQYFSAMSFPYVSTTNNKWKLFGPYPNAGELSKKFPPELKDFVAAQQEAAIEVTGGTIVLRHWWANLVRGVIPVPTENSTWYASQNIWSDEDRTGDFWIGFHNLSRSTASHSFPKGRWDTKESAVWVNGNLIAPPVWKRASQKGHSEIPLIDEGYEYREPTKILLKKGWNKVLIKAPVGTFKASDWQNPVKWMFTFVEVK